MRPPRPRRTRRFARLKDLFLTFAFLLLLILLAARLSDPGPPDVHLPPFRVVDGDTLAAGAARLRLIGLDAPELSQTCRDAADREWACGREARAALARLLRGEGVLCRGTARDRYHRFLVECSVDGQSVNGAMVSQGFAVASGLPGFEREQKRAEAERRGIWQGRFERPRDFRARSAAAEEDEDGGRIWQAIRRIASLDWL